MQPPLCIRGKACNCAYHTHRQHLFYEFVNLDVVAMKRAVERVEGCCIFGDFDVKAAPMFLMDVQDVGLLPQLWEAVKAEGGNLPGACPKF